MTKSQKQASLGFGGAGLYPIVLLCVHRAVVYQQFVLGRLEDVAGRQSGRSIPYVVVYVPNKNPVDG